MPERPTSVRSRRRVVLDATLVVLLFVWMFGTPACFWIGLEHTGPGDGTAFLSFEPTPLSSAFFTASLLCLFAAPVVGLLLALVARRPKAAVGFVLAAIAACVFGRYTGIITGDNARSAYHSVVPSPAPPTPGTGPTCREYSGGDTECPGG